MANPDRFTTEQLKEKLTELREQRTFYDGLFTNQFGDMPFETQLRIMQIAKEIGRDSNVTVAEMHRRLADEMLIVPAEKGNPAYEVSIDQLTTVIISYDLNRGIWDPVIGLWERSQENGS